MNNFDYIDEFRISATNMAFIVPVVRRDFILYNSVDKKKDRADSNPIELRKKNESGRKFFKTPFRRLKSCDFLIFMFQETFLTLSTLPDLVLLLRYQ